MLPIEVDLNDADFITPDTDDKYLLFMVNFESLTKRLVSEKG